MRPHPHAQPKQTKTRQNSGAEPTNQSGSGVSPVDLLDKFCGLYGGRGDISFKPAPQSGGSRVELLCHILPRSFLCLLHGHREFPSLQD